jgi:hypothetical protein
MKGGDGDNSPPSTPEGLCNVVNPMPGDDGSEQDDAYGEANVRGSGLENIAELKLWGWV